MLQENMQNNKNNAFRTLFYKNNPANVANGRYETGYVKYLTDSEFAQIQQQVEHLESPSLKTCLKIMMYLGLRIGEAIRLKRSDFNHDFSILIYSLEKSKKLHERHIPLFLQSTLQAYDAKYNQRMALEDPQNPESRYLFFANYRNISTNKHLARTTIALFFRDIRKRLGLTHVYYVCKDGKKLHRVSPHTLRHYALWKYYQASGNDLVMAQQMIGHKKVEVTARYINALKSGANELNILENSFNKGGTL